MQQYVAKTKIVFVCVRLYLSQPVSARLCLSLLVSVLSPCPPISVYVCVDVSVSVCRSARSRVCDFVCAYRSLCLIVLVQLSSEAHS